MLSTYSCKLSFLVTQMLPVSVLLTPMFIMFKNMHVYDTRGAAILADATIGIPFSVLILKNCFASIHSGLEEAARLDGCNRFTAFVRVLIPIAKPGVMVCAIFSFLYAWGDLACGMTFILGQNMRPITAGIFNFMGQYGKMLEGYDTACLVNAMKAIPLPEAGVNYEPSFPVLEATCLYGQFQNNAYGGMPGQLGMCWGRNTKLNCLVYHRDSEVNIGAGKFILLLARQEEIVDGVLDTVTLLDINNSVPASLYEADIKGKFG